MKMLKDIWESFAYAIIRFWENRFIKNDEVDYLRNELARVNGLYVKLVNQSKEEIKEPDIDLSSLKPIGNKFVPWSIRRQQLERNSIKEHNSIDKHRNDIEELERELDLEDKES